jgi:hypothetical protein
MYNVDNPNRGLPIARFRLDAIKTACSHAIREDLTVRSRSDNSNIKKI